MAVILVSTIQRFQAMSADTWPSNPPEGSCLHVIDTGEEYVFHDGTWEQDLRSITAMTAVW